MIRRAFILRQYLETNAPQIRTDKQFVIATDANGEKHLHLSRDGDIDEDRDCLSLI